MKIVYFFQYFATREMSGITRTYEFTRRLVAMGHEVHVVTTWHRGGRAPGWHTTDEDGVQVHWLTLDYDNKMSFLRRLVPFFSFALRSPIKGMRLSKGADLIYASSGPLTIVIPGMIVAALRRIPMVMEVRDVWPETAIALGALKNRLAIAAASRLERVAYRFSTRIVAASIGMKESIVQRGVDAGKVDVIPNSSDLDLFGVPGVENGPLPDGFPTSGGRKRVLYTGTLGRANNVDYLVDIAEASARAGHDIDYIVVGAGMEKEAIRAHAERAAVLGRNFYMIEPVAKQAIPPIVAGCHLSITLFKDLPALWNSSPNKFFDALASRRPVAINYGGWKRDLIERHDIGLVVPSNDPAEAAARIERFLADEKATRGAGDRARDLATKQFDRDLLASRLDSILRKAANA